MTRHRDRQIAELIRDIDRHNLTAMRTAVTRLANIDATGRNDHDGYPTTTPGNGATGGGRGRHITVHDERGEPDEVSVTSVEQAALARLETREADPVHQLTRSTLQALTRAADALNAVEANLRRFENLRSTAQLEDAPQCHVANVMYGLPYDMAWEPHRATDFAGYLAQPWNEPRKVCRFVYDFTRRSQPGSWTHRLPTKEEMLQYLERGTVRMHEPSTTNTRRAM